MVTTDQPVQEWTLDGVLDELAHIDRTMKDRQFVFILGAGASFTSGIPTGSDLAQKWLKDLHLRECANGLELDEWIQTCGIGTGELNLSRAAEYYPQIFERRFASDREAGYAELEAAMEGKSPSLGYSLLAEIIQHTRHKVVVTTNFDNLVADALAMHAHQSPLVVAHESLAGFVRPQLRRPLVAKIHRDLFLQPINDVVGVSTMEKSWRTALKKLFQYFTPVVVGYGGNDGSLMDMLADLAAEDIAGRMIWCYRDGAPPPDRALAVLRKHHGLMVKITGFDEFMALLAAKLVKDFDVAAIADRTEKLGKERADQYRAQAIKLGKSTARGSPAEQKAGTAMTQSVRSGKSWWSWVMMAQAEADVERRNRVYLEGLQQFPTNAELLDSYATFLADQRKDFGGAEVQYRKALELDPSNADIIGNYAILLALQGKDFDAAEVQYKKAIELDPSNANNIGNYANFLAVQRKDFDAAEAMYRKAIELDSSNARIARNYAFFLKSHRKDYDGAEAMYKKALELEPTNASYAGSYAVFLANQRKNIDAAEAMFKKAIELDPSDTGITGNYASFLANEQKDFAAAEILFKRALELDPGNANNTANYAIFLTEHRRDLDAAEALFKRALELDPSDARNAGCYANFLADQRDNLEIADAMYRRALELDPSHAGNTGNYAIFLADQRKDFPAAEAMYKKALELDPSNANNTSSYAAFLANQGKGLDIADATYRRALELDSSDPTIAGSYAVFLADHRKDFDAAEAMFKRALELGPSDANNFGNYANFLAERRKHFDAAEVMFKKTLELDPSKAGITCGYAIFLAERRKDFDSAEAMFKKALELDPNNADIIGSYAIFLAEQRKDIDAGEAMYKKAIELDPSNANHLVNYASALLAKGDGELAQCVLPLVHRALDISRPNVTQAVAEALLYGALVQELENGANQDDMLSRLKNALQLGYERGEWSFAGVFSKVLPRLPTAQRLLFQALGEAILDADLLSELDGIDIWRNLQPTPIFAPAQRD